MGCLSVPNTQNGLSVCPQVGVIGPWFTMALIWGRPWFVIDYNVNVGCLEIIKQLLKSLFSSCYSSALAGHVHDAHNEENMHQQMGRRRTICELPELKQSYRQRLSTARCNLYWFWCILPWHRFDQTGTTINQHNDHSTMGALLFLSHPKLSRVVTLCSRLLWGYIQRDLAIPNLTLCAKRDLPR
jgi:hypothetical protein